LDRGALVTVRSIRKSSNDGDGLDSLIMDNLQRSNRFF